MMTMFSDRRVNRKWRRIFRALFAVIGISMIITFFPLNEEVETVVAFAGFLAGLAGLVFLWFLYYSPEKLKMQDNVDDDI
jgi:membrane associated rhomboid family serine protease